MNCKVRIISPSGLRVGTHIVPTNEGHLVNFAPCEIGEFLISVEVDGRSISTSPFHFISTPENLARLVKAFGPGLSHGLKNYPTEFIVDTRQAGEGDLGVIIEGPCEVIIDCRDNGDGSCSVVYFPTEFGVYSINITFNDTHIYGSPFKSVISDERKSCSALVFGEGVQSHGLSSFSY